MKDEIRVGGARARLLRFWKPPTGRAPRIGLTGGIGAGKSTVARTLSDLGAVLADADAIAREVVAPGSEGLDAVVARFGAGVLDEDGALDRGALAPIVFADPGARRDLEAITHPLIARRAAEILAGAPVGGLAVYDVPLLAELGMEGLFDAVLVVEAPMPLRLERLEARGLDRSGAEARIASQSSDLDRRRIAHVVLENTGSAEDLAALVDRVDSGWLRSADLIA